MSFFKQLAEACKEGWNEGVALGSGEPAELVQDTEGTYVPKRVVQGFISKVWWYAKRVFRAVRNVCLKLLEVKAIATVAYFTVAYAFQNWIFLFFAKLIIVPIASLSIGLAEFLLFVWALSCTVVSLGFAVAGVLLLGATILSFIARIMPKAPAYAGA